MSEIRDLLGILQDQKRKQLDDLERLTKICHALLAKLEAAHLEVPHVEALRYLMAKGDEAVAVGKQSLHLFDESKIAKLQAAGVEVPNMEALRDLIIAKLDEAKAVGVATAAAAAADDDDDDGDNDHVYGLGGGGGG